MKLSKHIFFKTNLGRSIYAAAYRIRDRFLHKNRDAREIEKAIVKFKDRIYGSDKELIVDDIYKAVALHRIVPIEYFWYDFQHKDYTERKQFIGRKENKAMCKKLNENSPHLIFKDKCKTYDIFKHFFGRKAILIESLNDSKKFADFAEKAQKIIVKPLDGLGGQGIFILNGTEAEQAFDSKIKDNLPSMKYIAEEYIQQEDSFKALNSTSINTLRIATFLDGKDIVRLYACLRIGRTGAYVDNASSGGMVALVDMETGKVITGARDENCCYYEKHPDTGHPILGFNIPHWQEALGLAEKLAMVMPQQRYVGWDLALSKKGWVMVEGNAEQPQLLPQLASQKGIRPVFKKTVFKYL